MRHISILLFSMFSASMVCAQAQVIDIFPATKDNTLYELNTGTLSNAMGSLFVGVNNQFLIRRAVLQFDFSGVNVDISRVDSVKLRLSQTSFSPSSTSIAMSIHAVTRAWGEGTSLAPIPGGTGALITENDASWVYSKYPNELWTQPGGDFIEEPMAEFTIRRTDATVMSRASDEFITMLDHWVRDPASNYGILIKNADEFTQQDAVRFASRETAVSESTRPALVVYHRMAFTTTSIEQERSPAESDGPALISAYPNPFNPSTVVRYRLSVFGEVSVKVYDLLGREVAILVNERMMPAGQHSVTFDAAGLPSGVYVIVLETAGVRSSRKIALTK